MLLAICESPLFRLLPHIYVLTTFLIHCLIQSTNMFLLCYERIVRKDRCRLPLKKKTAVHNKYQRIYTKEETSKCQNLAENLKSEPAVDCKRRIRHQRQLLLFTDLPVQKIWEQKHFRALLTHTIIFIGPVPESLKEANSSPLILDQEKNEYRDLFFWSKSRKGKKTWHNDNVPMVKEWISCVYENFPLGFEKALLFPLKWQSFPLSSLQEDLLIRSSTLLSINKLLWLAKMPTLP